MIYIFFILGSNFILVTFSQKGKSDNSKNKGKMENMKAIEKRFMCIPFSLGAPMHSVRKLFSLLITPSPFSTTNPTFIPDLQQFKGRTFVQYNTTTRTSIFFKKFFIVLRI